MAKKIATFEHIANSVGFTPSSTDNPKQCVTKEDVLARLKSGYTINLDDYSDKQLIPSVDINPIYDWSYFRIQVTLPSATNVVVYACGRSNNTFTGSSTEDFDNWLAGGQRLNAEKYSTNGSQWDIKLQEGKWTQNPYGGNGGYLYIVLLQNGTYYLYGGKVLMDILGSSAFGAMDYEDYIDQMKPAYANNPNLGSYIKTLTKIDV